MDTKKRAIILDMDETLEHGTFKYKYDFTAKGYMMTLRPGLDELIEKLKVAKTQGIDIVLCTTAHDFWVERFLTLKPEFRELFDKIYTRDNQEEWNPSGCYQKPVENFGYDSILFIDDNRAERIRLCDIYNAENPSPVDITYFSGFHFGDLISLHDLAINIELANQDSSLFPDLQELLTIARNEPGCSMMCSVIDTFIEKEFKPGLTIEDEKYSQENTIYRSKIDELINKLEDIQFEKKDELGCMLTLTEEQLAQIVKYMDSDKRFPFEGIEQLLLNKLVQSAKANKSKLEEAQKLEKAYKGTVPKETTKGEQL